MEVKFINEKDGLELGSRHYKGISRILIPAIKNDGHDIYLTRTFNACSTFRNWLIKSIDTNNNTITIYLEGFNSPDSVDVYAKKQRRNFKSFIRKHNIVEVDFGHQTSLFCPTHGEQKNTQRTDSLMPGEMHKKRPCIVVGTMSNSVVVIPLTTKNSGNPKHIPITKASFSHLHERYHIKPSFAALNMIQTVSVHRVFPPREAISGNYRHQYSKYKLSDSDGRAVDNALADACNHDVSKELMATKAALENAKKEKFRLIEKNNELKREADNKDCAITEMQSVICHIAKEYGLTGSLKKIMSELKNI